VIPRSILETFSVDSRLRVPAGRIPSIGSEALTDHLLRAIASKTRAAWHRGCSDENP
jgi:hypothetical protein